jgi:hypothetical protein
MLLSACNDDEDDTGGEEVRFVFEMQGEGIDPQPFVAATSRADVIAEVRAELDKALGERNRHINGRVLRGDGGHNAPWSWHFDPDEWDLAEVSIELCDGNPTDVENDLDYWVDTVMAFCPWSARVVEEIAATE